MSNARGFILLDLLISLTVFCLVAQLLQSAALSRHSFRYRIEDDKMKELWQDEDYRKIWDPEKRIKPLEEKGDEPLLPPAEEGSP
ncbi:MAG: hypothetical protein IJS38_02685 [Erysipelotrichaceae bacterium]|nr:hypothetical protein [Erysipelotrichaceae bacterium]